MEINDKVRTDIIMFLEQQETMYDMAYKDPKANFTHRQGISLLQKRLKKVLTELKS